MYWRIPSPVQPHGWCCSPQESKHRCEEDEKRRLAKSDSFSNATPSLSCFPRLPRLAGRLMRSSELLAGLLNSGLAGRESLDAVGALDKPQRSPTGHLGTARLCICCFIHLISVHSPPSSGLHAISLLLYVCPYHTRDPTRTRIVQSIEDSETFVSIPSHLALQTVNNE